MITIYSGSRPLLPLLACQAHLEYDADAVKYVKLLLAEGWNWKAEPMRFIGRDNRGHDVCCVAHGRHGLMYHRAMSAISDLFTLETQIIDVDTIINAKASYHLWMAACLDVLKYDGAFGQAQKQKFLATLRTHIAGSR